MTTTLIVTVFLVGYVLIALESFTKINKSAIALLMSVICWTIYNVTYGADPEFITSFGETCETLFFLMGAMAIVEVIDTNGGFNFVKDRLMTKSKRALLWRLIFITFFLSAVLDNLTTSIVMIMVLNKLIDGKTDRLMMSSVVILAANSGGAFSPIGDVTTIMLWVKGNISSFNIIKAIILPSIVSVVVPGLLISARLKGEVLVPDEKPDGESSASLISKKERVIIFFIGVGGLIFVPVFRLLTDLPPFMGIMLVLGALWVVTELIFKQKRLKKIAADALPDIAKLLHKVDLSTIFFFLGILTTVAALSQTGVLKSFGESLDKTFDGNPYIVTGIIGVLSSIVDNVPLVASCMGMYDLIPAGADGALVYGADGSFWNLLSYCAGVGGSILIIGSAAGVVVMGLQKISFGWYLKNISWMAFLGYLAGIAVYWLQSLVF